MSDHICQFSTQVGSMNEAINTLKKDVERLRKDISRLFQQDETLRIKHMNEYNVIVNKIDDLCNSINTCANQIESLIESLRENEGDVLNHDKKIAKIDDMENNLNELSKSVDTLQDIYKKIKLYVKFIIGTSSIIGILWGIIYKGKAIIHFFKNTF